MSWARAIAGIVYNFLFAVLIVFVMLFVGQCACCVDVLDKCGQLPCKEDNADGL